MVGVGVAVVMAVPDIFPNKIKNATVQQQNNCTSAKPFRLHQQAMQHNMKKM